MQERHFLAMLTRLEAEMLNIDLVTLFIKNLNLFSVISVELFIADCSTLHRISSMRIVKSVDKLRDGFGPCLGVGQSLILLVLQLGECTKEFGKAARSTSREFSIMGYRKWHCGLARLLMRLSQPTVKNMRGTWECIQRVLDAHLTGRMFA
ncbi:hypothetical protein glysoja_019847 [Glycine soja]|uniref:Uncharacterized protein n=1 Tax=Glycine max TaxID=3847 RepID=I1L149_SOYBN|nr:hypothetical protein glysoja_019847 [Glycine soja]